MSSTLLVPTTFNSNPSKSRPLVIAIASRNNAVLTMLSDSGMTALASDPLWGQDGALVMPINGKTGSSGVNSWNGDLCCCWAPADGAAPNDSDYIDQMVDRIIARGYNVDPKRIFIYAQGGGGSAAAFRTACDHPTRYAAVFDFAGAGPVPADAVGGANAACNPTNRHVHFWHLHGTVDVSQEPYSGQTSSLNAGMVNHCPAATASTLGTATIDQLAAFNGCTGSLQLVGTQYYDMVTVGAPPSETDLYQYTGCPADGTVLFSPMNGEDHTVSNEAKNPNFKDIVINYFLTHGKP